MSEKNPPAGSHIDVFDGLRAVAIGLVMWLHTWQLSWMNNTTIIRGHVVSWGQFPECGFLGVELFFFISAFCLYTPYARHALAGATKPTLRGFLYRRAIKILPSYWLALALILAVTRPFDTWRDWAWQLGTHLTFTHNWFQDTRDTIDGVFWSLGVEIQFYLLFPLLAWLFRRYPRLTFVAMVGLALGWRTWVAGHWSEGEAPFWLSQLPGYFDLFAFGMLAAHYLVKWRDTAFFGRRQLLCTLAVAAGLWLFWNQLGSLYEIRYTQKSWPGGWQVQHRSLIALAYFIIGVGSAGAVASWRWLLSNRVAVFLSTISYNLYIWHQLLARILFNNRIPAPITQDPHFDPTWQWHYMVVAWVVSIAAATLVTYAFERPLLRHGVRGLWIRLTARLKRSPPERATTIEAA